MYGLASLNLLDRFHVVNALAMTTPSSTTPAYISVKNAQVILVRIKVKNATTVTGSAITLKQATAVAGTGVKALSFTNYYAKTDTATSDVPWVRTTAASDTFTTDSTNSKISYYMIPVDPASLDTNNGFDCIRVGTGDATATTLDVDYIVVPNYGGNPASFPSFIVD